MSDSSLSREEVLQIVREELAAQRRYERQKSLLETNEAIRRMTVSESLS